MMSAQVHGKTKHTLLSVMLLVLLAFQQHHHVAANEEDASSTTIAAAASIPCEGVTDPTTFNNIPLKQRPKLAKILQHGYRIDLQEATIPSFESPGNSVRLDTAFVDRPFRMIDVEHCDERFVTVPDRYMMCARQTSNYFSQSESMSLAGVLEKQLLLQASVETELTYPRSAGFLDVDGDAFSYAVDWYKTTVNALQQQFNCDDWVTFENYIQQFSCNYLEPCQKLDPEFIDDLKSLPTEDSILAGQPVSTSNADFNVAPPLLNEVIAAPYRAFMDKWGHGSVEGFRLGRATVTLRSTDPDPSPAASDRSTLYMGYLGGSGSDFASGNLDAPIYSDEECRDPEPIKLRYNRWNEFLSKDFYFNLVLPEDQQLNKRDELIEQFRWLYLLGGYSRGIYQQIREDLDVVYDWQCDRNATVYPTTKPTDGDSTASPTAAPTVTIPQSSSDEDSDDSSAKSLFGLNGMKFQLMAFVVVCSGMLSI